MEGSVRKPSVPSADDRFLNVLTATDRETEKPVSAKPLSELTRDGVLLNMDGKKITVWFNRDGEVGGEVIVGNASKPLANSVHPQKGAIL